MMYWVGGWKSETRNTYRILIGILAVKHPLQNNRIRKYNNDVDPYYEYRFQTR